MSTLTKNLPTWRLKSRLNMNLDWAGKKPMNLELITPNLPSTNKSSKHVLYPNSKKRLCIWTKIGKKFSLNLKKSKDKKILNMNRTRELLRRGGCLISIWCKPMRLSKASSTKKKRRKATIYVLIVIRFYITLTKQKNKGNWIGFKEPLRISWTSIAVEKKTKLIRLCGKSSTCLTGWESILLISMLLGKMMRPGRERYSFGAVKTSSERKSMPPNPKRSQIVLQPIGFGLRDSQVYGKESDLFSA